MFDVGFPELLLIVIIVVVVLGANKLPQIGDGMGQMIANFRKSVKGEESDSQLPAAGAGLEPLDKLPGA